MKLYQIAASMIVSLAMWAGIVAATAHVAAALSN